MAIDINSQEFANAWRLVSEGLLQFIQNRGQISNFHNLEEGDLSVSSSETKSTPPVQTQYHINQPPFVPEQESKTKIDERYAACPIRQQDGSYIFKNLKEECQPESTFKIIRYSDGSCDIALCDLQGEARQIFKDSKSDRLPSAVGIIIGEITAEKRIVNTKLGKGIVAGRSVKITEPLEVEFQ